MLHFIRLIMFFLPITITGQQRVLFADSLEERSEVNRIKDPVQHEGVHGKEYFTKMKMVERTMQNFDFQAEYLEDPKTRSKNQKMKRPLYWMRFAIDGTIIGGEPLYANANYSETGLFSYQLVGPDTNQATITGTTHAIQIHSDVNVGSFSFSITKPDTTFLIAEITLNDQKTPCTLEALFQGEGPNSIVAMALYQGDSIFIRTTNRAKKYSAFGVELYYHDKIIAGMQFPAMQLGPSYSVVDKTLPEDLKNMAYAILSVILYTNENRQSGF